MCVCVYISIYMCVYICIYMNISLEPPPPQRRAPPLRPAAPAPAPPALFSQKVKTPTKSGRGGEIM